MIIYKRITLNLIMKKIISKTLLILALLSFSACQQAGDKPGQGEGATEPEVKKIDDWQYDASAAMEDGSYGKLAQHTGGPVPVAMEAAAPMGVGGGGGNIGFSVGGAKDIGNFRENIKNGYLPIPTDITYEGLFYGYFFDTGQQEECNKLFCPSYSTAVSKDPFSEKEEYFLSVGLNSGIKEEDFQRKKLNLAIVMDISGSMGSSFDEYYYDRFGNYIRAYDDPFESSRSKMEIADKTVVDLLGHLEDEDRFGMVLFDDISYLAKPMVRVKNTDMDAIKDHILDIEDQGGTNMEAGMKEGTDLFKEYSEVDPEQYENRMIFITDAMPNMGDDSDEGLYGMLKKNAENGIYTTFIGVGVDFNTELVEALTKIRGANYYSVHSEKEFKETMDEGFDYMVTPLVFDLELKLEADGYEIEKVYGSPEADEATGEIMKVNTLFPSKTEEGEVRGGLVLLQLNKTSENGSLSLKVSYEDRNGNKESDQKNITFTEKEPDYYDNTGIRKGILLARYANLMKSWALEGHEDYIRPQPLPMPCPVIMMERGIYPPEPPFLPPCFPYPLLGEWERQSVPLNVDENYERLFDEFSQYMSDEIEALGDEDLQQEMDILEELAEV